MLYQGTHEYDFLQSLENICDMVWLSYEVRRGPSIWYIDPTNNTKKLYISDFIIYNTVYEIKSKWTWNKLGYDAVLVLNRKEIKYEK